MKRLLALAGSVTLSIVITMGAAPFAVQAAPVADPAALRIPDSVFAPASPLKLDQELGTTALDGGKYFTFFHQKAYTDLGRTDGYYEVADWTPSGASAPIVFRYLASIYPSSDQAAQAVVDSMNWFSTAAKAPLTPCDSRDNIPGICQDIALLFSNGQVDFHRDVQVGDCVEEVAVSAASREDADPNLPQIHATQNAITLAGIRAMNAVCSPATTPDFTLTGAQLLHKVKGKVKPTYALKLKEKAEFVVTYTPTNQGSLVPTAHLIVTKGTQTIAQGDMQAATASDGSPYFYLGGRFTHASSRGALEAQITITLGDVTKTTDLGFTVTKAKKH